jgi:hypothetical protein
MDSDTKFIFLVMGLPIAGLIYCGIGIALMANSPTIREHSLIAGALFLLIPLVIAASIWIKASAKAYKKNNHN